MATVKVFAALLHFLTSPHPPLATLSVQDISQGPLPAIYIGLLLKPPWALKM